MTSTLRAKRLAEAVYVDTNDLLGSAIEQMIKEPVLAFDTEFLRERTYFPELCLVQIASSDQLWCIDPIRLDNIESLFTLLADQQVTKLLHSARQDLEIFCRAMQEVPAPIFDTQVAAALIGQSEQIAYAALVSEMFGVSLDKSATRTDWSRRPLSGTQITYALNDVLYLEDLRTGLTAKLKELGRLSWFEEECALLVDRKLYLIAPEEAWRRIKGIARLSPAAFEQVVKLAAWRESKAQKDNLPRGWVLKDQTILDMAQTDGLTQKKLETEIGLNVKQVRRWGDQLLEVLSTKSDFSVSVQPADVGPLTDAEKKCFKQISECVKRKAIELNIGAPLLANRRDMEKAARGARGLLMYSGWRAGVIGKDVREIAGG